MTRPTPRTALRLLACALLASACDSTPQPEGECTGSYLGQSVRWPLTLDSVHGPLIEVDGGANTEIRLRYTQEGVPGFGSFGANILLMGEPRFDEGSSRTVKLLPVGERLAPEETSLVRRWDGHLGSGVDGYLSPPGVPVEASVTLDRVTEDHAAGRFVYRHADGDTLTCTFDVPDRIYDDGLGGGWGDGDDDDDDD